MKVELASSLAQLKSASTEKAQLLTVLTLSELQCSGQPAVLDKLDFADSVTLA